MWWFVLSFFGACSKAFGDLLVKKYSHMPTEILAWARYIGIFIVSIIVLIVTGLPDITLGAWITALTLIPVEYFGFYYMKKAYHHSPISLMSPMLGLTLVVSFLIGLVMIHEMPSIYGFIGLFAVIIGTYIIFIKKLNHPFEPLRNMLASPGLPFILITILLYGSAPVLQKYGFSMSSIAFILAVMTGGITILMTAEMFRKKLFKQINYKISTIYAVSMMGEIYLMQFAFMLTQVNYAMAVKRGAIFMTVLIGVFFFKETHLREKLVGSIVIIAGLVLLMIA